MVQGKVRAEGLGWHLALDIHEERVGGLHEALELVLALLQRSRRVEQVDVLGEHL